MIRVGLRFQHADAQLLRFLAERVKLMELGQRDVATFSSAAQAAETGEPLIVYAESLDEARLMAHGYSQYGVTVPTIDQLSAA